MKEKIEASLRRAAEQLPQPDFKAVADTPVQPLEVHDYVTRQEPLPRRRPFRPAAAALALCVLVLCIGLWSYFQFFQVYSVVDLRVNPAFAIELDRRDQVKAVNALSEDAGPILEGRSYRGWSLDATVEALLDDLWAGGYLDGGGAQVDVAVNSKSADHGRVLREEVEALIDAKLSSLTEGVEEDPETVLPTATIPADTPSAATTPAVTTPAVTTPPPTATPAATTPAVTTPPPATTPAVTAPAVTTPPPAATPAVTAPAVTTPPPATTPAVTAPAVTTPPVSDPPAASGQVLGWDQVQAIVTGRLPDAVFEEIQLDEDDGRLLYEVKFWDAAGEEYEAELDAFTGEILKWERD